MTTNAHASSERKGFHEQQNHCGNKNKMLRVAERKRVKSIKKGGGAGREGVGTVRPT